MDNIFITITGVNHYLGMKPFKVGRIVKIIKDTGNEFDTESIRVELPYIETVGYVANSANTVFAGTFSAGRLYEKIGDYAYAQVMFITHSSVIALVLPPEAVEKEADGSDAVHDGQAEVERKSKGKASTAKSSFKIGF